MSTELYQKVYDFLANSPLEHITASSVIFQIIEEEPWITKEESRNHTMVTLQSSDEEWFDDAFEGVCSLHDISAVKLSIVQKKPTPLYKRLLKDLDNVPVLSLSQKSPLASQKPARWMASSSIPSEVRDVCRNFVSKHSEFQIEVILDLLSHDGNWKDSKEVLSEVTIGILNTLSDSWENPAFGSEFVSSLNEDTYVTNVIVSAIWVTLKNFPFEKSSFIKRQSTASADRKKKGQFLQVAGDILYLNVLIRDEGNFHRYCYLRSVKIPIQLEDSDVVNKFIKALLIVRNIIIVNISWLYYAPISRSERRMEDSSTVDSE
ncbi:hypothetical protein C1645_829061 [Glomus cerebriforme]|uniref:Uncharacterized protein n=1 Tax=Glomus cerebriforme TaxID=658196 RepID=A0A397SPQ7_9GLOM|nr:hypothetical protein C1645_829061 [Glomus cerebriforme]